MITPKKTIQGEVAFSLTMVWAHPYQAHLSSMDKAVKKITLLANSGNNWVYTFVWFNEDAQHVPLPKEGHLRTMIDGTPSRNTCRHLHQLEVWQLLQCRDHMVYPKGLNGDLKPVLTFPIKNTCPRWEYTWWTYHKPSFISVDLFQFTLGITCLRSQLPAKDLPPLPLSISL